MMGPRDAQFEDEAQRFHLKMFCEECSLFDENQGCAHGYPTAAHRKPTPEFPNRGPVHFCKDFDAC